MFRERNVLLAKDDIGRPKQSTYDLPGQDHAYGVKNRKEEYGAGKLTTSWQVAQAVELKNSQKDFQKLNRMGVNAKIIRPQQVSDFRKNHDVWVKKKHGQPPRVSSVQAFASVGSPVNPDPQIAAAISPYGKANRTQTPVKGIINNTYGIAAEQAYSKQTEMVQKRVSLSLTKLTLISC